MSITSNLDRFFVGVSFGVVGCINHTDAPLDRQVKGTPHPFPQTWYFKECSIFNVAVKAFLCSLLPA